MLARPASCGKTALAVRESASAHLNERQQAQDDVDRLERLDLKRVRLEAAAQRNILVGCVVDGHRNGANKRRDGQDGRVQDGEAQRQDGLRVDDPVRRAH